MKTKYCAIRRIGNEMANALAIGARTSTSAFGREVGRTERTWTSALRWRWLMGLSSIPRSRAYILFFHVLVLIAVSGACAADALAKREWTVDSVAREALVHAPAKAKAEPTPVVFAFHGHGGSMNNAARSFGYHTRWPEAIVVYPQGLNTPGRLTDPEGKRPGWQHGPGDQDDRDLKFFDAMLESLKRDYRVDEKRMYATGHSNGGGFTYLLWAMRGDRFAAFAPSASAAGRRLLDQLKPKPVLHVAGENDQLVKYAWQQLTLEALRKVNQCGAGKPWGKWCTLYASKAGAPLVTYIHPGTHRFPPEAPPVIVKFFKEHAKP